MRGAVVAVAGAGGGLFGCLGLVRLHMQAWGAYLRPWNFVLETKTALSERSEFAIFASALNKIPQP